MYKPAGCSSNQSLSFMVVLISMKGKSPEGSSDFIGEMLDVLRAIVSAVRQTCIFKSKKTACMVKKKHGMSLVLVFLASLLNKMVMFVAND